MAENRVPAANAAPKPAKESRYVPAAQRKPPSQFTVMQRVERLIMRLEEAQRAGVIAWLRGRFPIA